MTVTKKKRGPLPTGKGTLIGVRFQPAPLGSVDAWAATQADRPSRPEAIRRLVHLGLANPQVDVATSETGAETPSRSIGSVVDFLSDLASEFRDQRRSAQAESAGGIPPVVAAETLEAMIYDELKSRFPTLGRVRLKRTARSWTVDVFPIKGEMLSSDCDREALFMSHRLKHAYRLE